MVEMFVTETYTKARETTEFEDQVNVCMHILIIVMCSQTERSKKTCHKENSSLSEKYGKKYSRDYEKDCWLSTLIREETVVNGELLPARKLKCSWAGRVARRRTRAHQRGLHSMKQCPR